MQPMMQYNLDIRSPQAEVFKALRKIICQDKQIKEIKNTKQTSYKDAYSTVCMMRVRQGKVHLSFANGFKMQETFTELLGEGKIVRYLEFIGIEEIQTERLKAMIAESLLLNMEKYELRKLRCDARHKVSKTWF